MLQTSTPPRLPGGAPVWAGLKATRPAWTAALAVATLAACGADAGVSGDAGSNGTPDAGQTAADAGLRGDDAGANPADAGANPVDAGMTGGPMCPPSGPFGIREGDVLPDLALMDCAGNPVSTHELCGFDAAYFFVYADW